MSSISNLRWKKPKFLYFFEIIFSKFVFDFFVKKQNFISIAALKSERPMSFDDTRRGVVLLLLFFIVFCCVLLYFIVFYCSLL